MSDDNLLSNEETAYLDDSETTESGKYPRPLDYMNYFKKKKVTVFTRHRGKIVGTLNAFDLNLNLGIVVAGRHEFIKGEDVLMITAGEIEEFLGSENKQAE